MKRYEVEYTTNIDDRHTEIVEGDNITDAYLKFVVQHPKHYAITGMTQLGNGMAFIKTSDRVHVVKLNGKEQSFLSITNALNYIRKERGNV